MSEEKMMSVHEADERVSRLHTDLANVRTELVSLEGGAAASVISGGDAGEIASRLAALREQSTVLDAAAGEAERLAAAARSEMLMEEAARLEVDVEAAGVSVGEHEAKVARALAALEKVSGASWRLVSIDMLIEEANAAGRTAVGVSAREPVVTQLRRAEARARAVQQVVEATARSEAVAAEVRALVSFDDLPAIVRAGDAGCVRPALGFAPPQEGPDYAAEADVHEAEVGRLENALAELESVHASSMVPSYGLDDRIAQCRRDLGESRSRMFTAQGRAGMDLPTGVSV